MRQKKHWCIKEQTAWGNDYILYWSQNSFHSLMPLITFPIIQEHIISLKYSKGTTTNTIGKTALLATQSFLDHAILHPIFTLLNFANTFVFIKHGPQPWAQPPNWRTRSSSTFTRDNIRTSLLVVMQEVYPSCNHYCKALY